MHRCPKCCSTRIDGPKYRRLGWGGEALEYRCVACGYTEQGPTADAAVSRNAAEIVRDYQ